MASTTMEYQAAAAKALGEVGPVSATRSYAFKLDLHELYGRAFISWSLDPTYAIGANDAVLLYEGDTYYALSAVKTPTSSFDTGHAWGKGLIARYWAYDYATSSYKFLVVTPAT